MLTGLTLRLSARLLAAPAPSPTPAGNCGGRVSINIDDGAGAPGISGFQHVANIVAAAALIGCAAAVLGGIFVATSGRIADQRVAAGGRLAIVGGVLGAFGIGITAAVVNFAYNTGANSC